MEIRTKYIFGTTREYRGYDGTYTQNITLETTIDGWQMCKKEHGLWVAAHPIINHKCPSCGRDHFAIRWNKPNQRNIKVAECTTSGCSERIEFDSYKVPTPDQAVGVWRKVGGKWCVKIISGTVGEEVVVLSKKGNSIKKAKKLTFVK